MRLIDADTIDYKHYKQHKHGKFNKDLLGDAKTLEDAFYQGVMYIHNCIEETPTADVVPKEIADEAYAHGYTEAESKYRAILERKRGKWIRITQGAMPEQYICPFCHRTVEAYDVEELLSIRYPYCHCGADMRPDNAPLADDNSIYG